jgi:hypothetical protein
MTIVQQLVALISWPVAGLIFGLVAMFFFRQPLVRLLDRTRRITRTGLEADAPPQDTAIKPSAAEELQRLFDNALLVQRETQIRSELERLAFRDPSEREKFLIRILAAAAIIQQFERTYAQIWGSQLGALQFLNSLPAGADAQVIRPWYDQAAGRDPQIFQNYSFDQWLGFLQSQQLIIRKENMVAITLEGREFLKYLLHQGYPLYRPG